MKNKLNSGYLCKLSSEECKKSTLCPSGLANKIRISKVSYEGSIRGVAKWQATSQCLTTIGCLKYSSIAESRRADRSIE